MMRAEGAVVVLGNRIQSGRDVVDRVIRALEIVEGSIDVAVVADEEVYREDILTGNDQNVIIAVQ